MRQFYLLQKGATLSHQLTWPHYVEILKFKNINEINYYIDITDKQNLSVRGLRERIKSNEYERLSDDAKNKLINKELVLNINFNCYVCIELKVTELKKEHILPI